MGTYGFTRIYVEYGEEAGIEQINNFIKELKEHQELSFKEIDMDYFEIDSSRLQNLSYQENIVQSIAEKHMCVQNVQGSSFIEGDSDLYFVRDEKWKHTNYYQTEN